MILALSRTAHDAQNAIVHEFDDGTTIVWELLDDEPGDAILAAPVDVRPGWLMRHDRIDFPPAGIAYRHTHPGPGIRYLLFGVLTIESGGAAHSYHAGEPWFESGPEPVLATASPTEATAFTRVLLLPPEWAGKRTITYVDPADEERPKLQRPTVYREQPIALSRTAAKILVDQLLVHGVDSAFCVPGESYLQVLDALRDTPIRLVTTRHEAAAANMAEAYGKLTGRPGVCLVTRAPGATHASVGVHTAYQDSTPLVLLVGQVPREHMGREAFQELDYPRMFGEMAKWVTTMDDAAGVPELVARAFQTATSGRPGPVVIALPEDAQGDQADVADAAPYEPSRETPSPEDVERVREMLAASERPMIVVGGGGWSAQAARDVIAFAEGSRIPVVASWRRQSYVDNTSPAYAGMLTLGLDPKLAERVRQADVVLALGTRLGEIATQEYTLLETPRPRQTLIHVHADPDELGRVYEPALGIVSGSPEFAAALVPVEGDRREWFDSAKADYTANLQHSPGPGDLDLGAVLAFLRRRLPSDAILTNGAGNYSVWTHRFYEFREYATQLAPCAGAMGYGFPAALAAKFVHPERTVVCFAGDGDFLMSGSELATAVQYDLPVVVLVVNNGMLGTIRMHQERHFPGRPVATDLVNPDFAAYARSFGAHGAIVERTDDFAPAFEAALSAGGPAVLELRVDPEAITPRATLGELRGR